MRKGRREEGIGQTCMKMHAYCAPAALPTGDTTFNKTDTLMDLIILQKKPLQATETVGALCKHEGLDRGSRKGMASHVLKAKSGMNITQNLLVLPA